MQTIEKTKTKTLVAVALVTLAVAGIVAGTVTVINQQAGGSSNSAVSSANTDSCLTASDSGAAAAGYWDSGNYSSCVNNMPTCVNGSKKVIMAETMMPDGSVKYSTACVLANMTSSVYSCTGNTPANATLCSGDDTGLTADTAKNLVSTCGTPKCEYTCNSDYALSAGGVCTANVSQVATPTATPAAGTYTSAQSVTLATTTSGADIYYTTNGSDPTTSSTKYTAAIAISATITLKAIAIKSGMTNSGVMTALYTISNTNNTAPTIISIRRYNPIEESTSASSVVLRITFSEAVVNVDKDDFVLSGTAASAIAQLGGGASFSQVSPSVYDCTIPVTFSGTFYLSISGNQNIKDLDGNAYILSGNNGIAGVNEQYNFNIAVATPSAIPVAGTYTSAQSVMLGSTTQGNIIYYTTDGSNPTTNSTLYTGAIIISQNTTLKAMAIAPGTPSLTNSGVLTAAYVINEQQVATPTITPAAGTYDEEKSVTIATATTGASIHYTTDGSTPTSASTLFGNPVKIAKDTTIKAIAIKSGMTNSNILTAVYKIKDSIKNSQYYKLYKYYRDHYRNKVSKADYLKVRDIRQHNMAQYVEMKNIYLIYKGLSDNELKELDTATLKKFYLYKHYNGYKNYLYYKKKVGA